MRPSGAAISLRLAVSLSPIDAAGADIVTGATIRERDDLLLRLIAPGGSVAAPRIRTMSRTAPDRVTAHAGG